VNSDEIKIKTSCRKCVFAIFDNNIQTGCKFNRTDIFRQKNKLYEIKEDDNLFFIIDTMCNTCRDVKWADKYEDPMNQVKKEIEPKIHTFIVDKSDDNADLVKHRILSTVKSLNKSSIKPYILHLVIQNYNLTTEVIDILNIVKEKFNKNTKLTITYALDRELDMVDSAISLVEQPYYMVVKSGEKLPSDYIDKFNKAINSELSPVVMTNKIYLTGLHKSLGGNKIETYKNSEGETITLNSLHDKIMILVDEQNNPGAVLSF
jgi:hypothetical protein